ncbi:MAG: DUF2752 domain-containing protein [Christensenellales bacterium]|jgi:hypothetical protein
MNKTPAKRVNVPGTSRSMPIWGMRLLLILALMAGALLLFGVYLLDPAKREGPTLPCATYTLFRIYCPGCGMTRAVSSVLHGRFLQALRYNVFVTVLPFVGYFAAGYWLEAFAGRPVLPRIRYSWKFLLVLCVAVMLYGILRNLPWPFFSFLAPTTI